MSTKRISVVMATFKRAELLERQLKALSAQTMDRSLFEILVVDDGSGDETESILAGWKSNFSGSFQYFTQKNGGPAKARNLAAKHATGEILAFTDDDCEVAADWLESILTMMDQNTSWVGLQGATYTKADEKTPLTHQIENLKGHAAVPTCNAAYRREFFEQIGGFDDQFPFPHNEDADLAWRMQEFGEIGFAPSVRVYHPPRVERFSKAAKKMRMLVSEFYLYEKQPVAYKKFRSSSPWVTIFVVVLLQHGLRTLRSHFRYVFRPELFFQGMMLSVTWTFSIFYYLPMYVRHARLASRISGEIR